VHVLDAMGRTVRLASVGRDGLVELGGLPAGHYLLRSAVGAVLPVQVE
jgi:hypothetical protein